MSSPLDNLLKISVGFVEAGLMATKAAAQTMQAGLEALAGPKSVRMAGRMRLSMNGRRISTRALAELANQMIRVGRLTPPEANEIMKAAGEVVQSARRSFGYLKPGDPRIFMLPLTAASVSSRVALGLHAGGDGRLLGSGAATVALVPFQCAGDVLRGQPVRTSVCSIAN